MDIEIVCRDFELTESIEYHIHAKLARVVTWRSRDLDYVRVTIGDDNGPRGGVDKYCFITIGVTGGNTVRVEDMSSNLYRAISRAAGRAERVVRDEIAKARMSRRRRSLAVMWG